jgi:hypothetical protein
MNLDWGQMIQKIEEKGHKCLKMKMKMFNGEKSITIDIYKIKLFMRPYIFMLLSHFFIEGLPKYKLTDRDLPNVVLVNPEDSPKMNVELNMNKSMICIDDEKKAVVAMTSVTFILD